MPKVTITTVLPVSRKNIKWDYPEPYCDYTEEQWDEHWDNDGKEIEEDQLVITCTDEFEVRKIIKELEKTEEMLIKLNNDFDE